MNVSIQAIKTHHTSILMLAALLIYSFTTHSAQKSTPRLTPKAQQILNSVISASNNLFSTKTEQTPTGATRSMSLRTLQSQYPDFDLFLSNVKKDDLVDKFRDWQKQVSQAINFLDQNTFDDKTLRETKEAYKKAYSFFDHIMERYVPTAHGKKPYFEGIIIPINGKPFQQDEQAMNQARKALDKEFGRVTFNREGKNSTRILLINLIDLLNKNIHTVRKRAFELDRDLKIRAQEQASRPPVQERRPHELPAGPLTHPQLERPVPAAPRKRPSSQAEIEQKKAAADIAAEKKQFEQELDRFSRQPSFYNFQQLISQWNPAKYEDINDKRQFDDLIKRYRGYIERIQNADNTAYEKDIKRYEALIFSQDWNAPQEKADIRTRWSPEKQWRMAGGSRAMTEWYRNLIEDTQKRYKNYTRQFDLTDKKLGSRQ